MIRLHADQWKTSDHGQSLYDHTILNDLSMRGISRSPMTMSLPIVTLTNVHGCRYCEGSAERYKLCHVQFMTNAMYGLARASLDASVGGSVRGSVNFMHHRRITDVWSCGQRSRSTNDRTTRVLEIRNSQRRHPLPAATHGTYAVSIRYKTEGHIDQQGRAGFESFSSSNLAAATYS